METIRIPSDTPFFTQRVTLSDVGQDFVFSFSWNERSGWFVGLADSQGSPIFSPKKVVVGWDLLLGCTDDRRPPGRLMVVDLQGQDAEPTYDDFGARVVLVYCTLADLA